MSHKFERGGIERWTLGDDYSFSWKVFCRLNSVFRDNCIFLKAAYDIERMFRVDKSLHFCNSSESQVQKGTLTLSRLESPFFCNSIELQLQKNTERFW